MPVVYGLTIWGSGFKIDLRYVQANPVTAPANKGSTMLSEFSRAFANANETIAPGITPFDT